MTGSYLHGIDIIELVGGSRPIRTVKSGVIGIVGTAPDAGDSHYPLNTPVLLLANDHQKLAALGDHGTLPIAVENIFAQIGAMIVLVRVTKADDDNAQLANIIGGVDDAGQYQGAQALLACHAVLGVTPRILIAPGFTHEAAVVNALTSVAQRLRAMVIADGPNQTDEAVITYRQQFDSARVLIVDPEVRVYDSVVASETDIPTSSLVAGVMARVDHERGFWCSPSNQVLHGVLGTTRPIDFALGDPTSRANRLNEAAIATIIHLNGYRLWGQRTCSSDPKWAFVSVRRTADMIHESLLQAHHWAIDRNLSKTYIDEVKANIHAYLRHLKALGAIIDGDCWADPAMNTPDQLAQGHVYFDFDFTSPYPAEHITFRSHLVNDYLTEILPD